MSWAFGHRQPIATKDLHATIRIPHALTMFVVTEAQAAMIRTAYEQRGEFSAAVELRQLFPGIRQCAGATVRADHRRLAATAQAATSGGAASR